MFIDPELLAFSGAVLLLTLTPGADTLLVMRNAIVRSWHSGIATTLGICLGLLVHAALSAVGLAVLLRSSWAFEIVRWGGVVYLVYLGIQAFQQSASYNLTSQITAERIEQGKQPEGLILVRRSLVEGLLTNLLNPKVVVFYIAFLPQFIRPQDSPLGRALLLASIHIVFSFVWLAVVTFFLQRMRALLARLWVRRSLQYTTGGMLLLFGLRLAFEKR
jgi:threonine/homoserine/homoserine lactone efflux protein